MIEVRPFREYRYNQKKISDLSDVIAPPYDVINEKERKILGERSKYNFINLTLPKIYEPDKDSSKFYEESSSLWNNWKNNGVIGQSEVPKIFCLKETYETGNDQYTTRFGFFVELSLSKESDSYVLRHEKTHKAPRMDRVKLYQATKANLSPIFFIYQDDVNETDKFLKHFDKSDKIKATLSHRGKVSLELSSTEDPLFIDSFCKSFKNRYLLIADGHHRYEASRILNIENKDKLLDSSAVLAYVVPSSSKGLLLNATHRGLDSFPNFSEENFYDSLEENFHLDTFSDKNDSYIKIYTKNKGLISIHPKSKTLDSLKKFLSKDVLTEVSVVVLQEIIFKEILGMTDEDISKKKNLKYFQNYEDGIKLVSSGDLNVAFFLNPIELDDLFKVTLAGGVLPQKSTYFYPKVATGLVIRSMES
ncbi:MAG: DUF1015 family protein [Candidatus Neomarinimicrobiota bacterium]